MILLSEQITNWELVGLLGISLIVCLMLSFFVGVVEDWWGRRRDRRDKERRDRDPMGL